MSKIESQRSEADRHRSITLDEPFNEVLMKSLSIFVDGFECGCFVNCPRTAQIRKPSRSMPDSTLSLIGTSMNLQRKRPQVLRRVALAKHLRLRLISFSLPATLAASSPVPEHSVDISGLRSLQMSMPASTQDVYHT